MRRSRRQEEQGTVAIAGGERERVTHRERSIRDGKWSKCASTPVQVRNNHKSSLDACIELPATSNKR